MEFKLRPFNFEFKSAAFAFFRNHLNAAIHLLYMFFNRGKTNAAAGIAVSVLGIQSSKKLKYLFFIDRRYSYAVIAYFKTIITWSDFKTNIYLSYFPGVVF